MQWIDELDRRRAELAQAAERRLATLPLAARIAPCERIVQSALDEAGETMAFLEDMSLRRAVDRLELLGDDLAGSPTLAAMASTGRPPKRRPPTSPMRFPCRSQAAMRASAAGEADRAETAEQDRDLCHRAARARRRGPETPARTGAGSEPGAAVRSSASGRRSCSLSAWRNSSAGGSSRLLENTVLVLILVLFVLIAGEAVLERARPAGALGLAALVLRLGRPGGLLGVPL